MQIIINLSKLNEDASYLSRVEKRTKQILLLSNLLEKLSDDGYRINTLYGRFIFDLKNREVIDCGEPGEAFNGTYLDLAENVFGTGGKLAIIFVNKKYIVFADTFFVAINFCCNNKVNPLSLNDVLEHYDELIDKENILLLNDLYFKNFEANKKNI